MTIDSEKEKCKAFIIKMKDIRSKLYDELDVAKTSDERLAIWKKITATDEYCYHERPGTVDCWECEEVIEEMIREGIIT